MYNHRSCELGCDETNTVMKHLANKIAMKWEKPLSEVTGFNMLAILRATNIHVYAYVTGVHMDHEAEYLISL